MDDKRRDLACISISRSEVAVGSRCFGFGLASGVSLLLLLLLRLRLDRDGDEILERLTRSLASTACRDFTGKLGDQAGERLRRLPFFTMVAVEGTEASSYRFCRFGDKDLDLERFEECRESIERAGERD